MIESDNFNAFATPDNCIFVLSKVFDELITYEQLAALLSHEYAHIKNRHGMKLIAQNLSWELLSAVLINNENEKFISSANKLLSLSNSREFELEADKVGLSLLEKNQLNPSGMIEILEITENIEHDVNQLPFYLNTHPSNEERVKSIKENLNTENTQFRWNQRLHEIFNELTD